MTDIEGVAGVVSHEQHSYPTGKYYEDSKKLLTGEVNAAVDGLLAAGVEKVLVADGHGPGAICFELLHPKALLLHGRPITRQQLLNPMWEYDAVVMIGQHARAGTADGNQSHTQDSLRVDWMELNGHPVGETLQLALWAGWKGVPVIFVGGDAAACREAEEDVPGITTAVVKWGIGTNCEISRSAQASCALINERIQLAVEKHKADPVGPIRWEPPYALTIRWLATHDADNAEHQSDCERVDAKTVQYRSDNLIDVLCGRHRG